MTTIKISADTHKRLVELKGDLMVYYATVFTFDEIIYAILEYLDRTESELPRRLESALYGLGREKKEEEGT